MNIFLMRKLEYLINMHSKRKNQVNLIGHEEKLIQLA